MRLILTTVAASAVLATGFVASAYAHGGSYRGPAGEVPPDSREPSDPPPPPEGGGPGTPGGQDPGGPTTGGGGVGGPTTGGGGSGGPNTGGDGGAPPGAGGGGTGPTTGGKGKVGGNKGPGYEDWTFWWNFNKDEILSLKSQIKKNQAAATPGSVGAALGGRSTGTAARTATDAAITSTIVPALRDLLNQKDLNFDIQSAAELALAKIGDPEVAPKLMEIARNETKGQNYNKVVVESAALALGLLQKDTPEIRDFLLEIVQDKKRNDSFIRPFAAVSLGLLGSQNDRDNVVPAGFIKVLNGDESKEDIKPSCLLAMGLLKNDSQCEALLTMLKSGKTLDNKTELSDSELAFVVQALGKIGRLGLDKPGAETAILDEVLAQAEEKSKADRNVRRSCAIALGQFGPRCEPKLQAKVLLALKAIIEKTNDPQERHFGLIALGRIGAFPGVDKALQAKCIETLGYYVDKGKQLTPPFAALGLGLIGRQMVLAGETVPEDSIKQKIRNGFADTKEAKARGAYAVASGLVKDGKAVKDLVDTLKDTKADNKLRGYCALGLGMIGNDPTSREAIKTALTNDSDRELRVQTAVAAGLIGDSAVINDLVKILTTNDESQYVLGSVALALGQIGDERAIPVLVDIAKDEKKFPDLTRALATVALGQIGDRREFPTLARVATDINYRAHVPAITELLTIL